MKRIALACGLLFLAGCVGDPLVPPPLVGGDDFRLPGGHAPEQAKETLTQAAQVYASAESYLDEGLVLTTFIDSDGERVTQRPFNTAFVRPDRFRYEYRDRGEESRKYIVGRDGERVRTWWHVGDRLREMDDLSLALAGATGVSGGSAHTIPRLLMPDTIRGFVLTDLLDVELLGEEEVDGAACYKIQGRHPRADWQTLWIEKDRMLVRRIDQQTQFDTFRPQKTTTYQPQINIEIRPDDLAFDPP